MSPLLWVRIGGALAVAALLAAGWWHYNGLRDEAAKVPVLEQKIRDVSATIEQIRGEIEIAQKASEDYQDELEKIRAVAASTPAPVVRLCRSTASATGVQVPGAASGPDAPSTGNGELSPGDGADSGAGIDIGRDLFALADRADACAAQLRGLQGWVTTVGAPPAQ